MKVLRLIPSMASRAGGTVTAVKETNAYLRQSGFEVTVVSLDAAGELIESESPLIQLGGGVGFYGYNRELDRWLEGNIDKFSVLIIEGCWQYVGLAGRRAALKAGVPYFVFTHGMLDPWFKRAYPWKHLKKYIYWLLFEHAILRDARAVLFTTERERDLAKGVFSPYEVCAEIVPLGISRPLLKEGSETSLRYGKERPYLLFLGRLYEKKGVDLLLEAYLSHSIQETHDLVLAGPMGGQRFEDLVETALKSGRVFWEPMIEGNLKWQILKQAAALILPSHQENFGLVIPEALAMGTPVLTTHPVNIAPIVEAAKAGFIEEDSLAGTRRLLDQWLELSPEDEVVMRANALKCFEGNFNISETTKALVAVLKDTLD